MRNLVLASDIGFDPVVLKEDGFLKRWAIFRDSESNRFIRLFLEQEVMSLSLLLENAEPSRIEKLQGQVLEAKKLKIFFEQPSISNEVDSMKRWLGISK